MENRLNVEYIPVGKLKPYDKNTRKHEDYDVSQIAKSIEQYGFNDPIGIWGKDNIIVEGHGRLLAAKKLGIDKVPCIRLDDLTDEQRREYAIMHNKTAELSTWDFDLLAAEIDGLDFSGFDIDWGLPADEEETEITEDDPPEVDEEHEPICQLGDIWQLGRHKLICGDSTDKATVERLMDGEKADMVFTDPPYGYSYQSNMRVKSEKFAVIENDDKILNFFPIIQEFNNGFVYVCTTWKVADLWTELFKQYLDLTNVIIWDKGCGGMGDLYHTFSTDYEMILVCNNGKEIKGKRYGSVWNFSKEEITKMKKEQLLKILIHEREYYSIWKDKKDNSIEYLHPTQKPVGLSARAIRSSCEQGEILFDLFGGSGSTLIACEQLDRTCYMCELDPKYCDVILKRYINIKGSSEDVYRLNADGTKTKYSDTSAI